MFQSNKEVYENLKVFLTGKESKPVLPKVKFYLDHYVKDYSIANFKVEVNVGSTVERLTFFTNEDKTQYRRITFIPDGDVLSIMHYEESNGETRCIYGLASKSISRINNCK